MSACKASEDKPRRLEEDTASYLADIELQFSDELEAEDKDTLIENVLAEIKQRTASAASDRRTNFLIEKMCMAANAKNLLDVAVRLSPYSVFLARNRFSSHILQVITIFILTQIINT